MSKNRDFLGGFIAKSNLMRPNVKTTSGVYTLDDCSKMRIVNSWGQFFSNEGIGVVFSGIGSTTLPSGVNHVFVSVAGGAGSGAHDVDCQGQGPGGAGGGGKAVVELASVGTAPYVINYTVGSGGPGVFGNDAFGSDGGLSRIIIGNFSITANGGQGGRSKNAAGAAGAAGNVTITGPVVSSLTSGAFSTSGLAVTYVSRDFSFDYAVTPSSSTGTPGACGNTGSLPGTSGFVYVRYGNGINGSATVTAGQDPPTSGPTAAYTPSY